MNKNKTMKAVMPVVAAGMVAASAIPVLAATPSGADTATVTINNVDEAATVTAYRIVEPTYNANGFVNFKKVDGVTMADIENPTAQEITDISQAILNGTLAPAESVVMTSADGKTYTGDLKAGEYVVLVTNQADANVVYNPMVVSAYYQDANDDASLVASTALNAEGNFTGDVYAKKTKITVDKTILAADGAFGADASGAGAQGDDLAVGDTGSFQISTKIPAYSEAYKAKGVNYTIKDTQDDGFDAPENLVVKVGDEEIEAGADTFAQNVTGNDFELVFTSDFALEHAGQDVVVTYDAKLNENATQKFTANNDEVAVTYTNSVTDKSVTGTLKDKVQEYTFPVQIKKTGDEGVALEGAEFTLTRIDADTKTGQKTWTVQTNEEGVAQFDRLDEGVYEVIETAAPSGYTLNPDTFQITVTPVYGDDGMLESYSVNMVNKSQENAPVGDITVGDDDASILAGTITDGKLQTLPSTGGNGTQIAIIMAAGLAGVTACVFAYGKKKESKESAE